jgi:hypothetical protein
MARHAADGAAGPTGAAAAGGLPFGVNVAATPVEPVATSHSPHLETDADERRRRTDRRLRPTRMLGRHALLGGRRATVRRAEERDGAFVDVHGPRLFALVLAIVALNLLDAWFTLLFLSHGGRELNPVVQSVLDLGAHPWPFLLMKTIGIGCACAFLALTKNFRSARFGLWFVLAGYTLLLGWHCWLLSAGSCAASTPSRERAERRRASARRRRRCARGAGAPMIARRWTSRARPGARCG